MLAQVYTLSNYTDTQQSAYLRQGRKCRKIVTKQTLVNAQAPMWSMAQIPPTCNRYSNHDLMYVIRINAKI